MGTSASGTWGIRTSVWATTGQGNVGFGNTGTGNIGFGNTGTGNIGFGLTGNNQIGFGGFNSGTGNIGLFNSGTGNAGLFNSGSGNWGVGNSGSTNTGAFNSGDVNSGLGNAGSVNTGWHNVGSYNSGNANIGDTNTGAANTGDINTGWLNSGGANTGLANRGDLNTGAFNTGTANNGFGWRGVGGGQLDIDIGATVSPIPIRLTADIPVNIPVAADLGALGVDAFTIGGFPITTTNWTTIYNQVFNAQVNTGKGLVAIKELWDFTVLNGVIPVSAISIPVVTVDLPVVTGTVGDDRTSIPVTFEAGIGSFRISLLNIGGPGLFNSPSAVSSGWFNAGSGGSGVFNSGTAASGFWNVATQQLLQGAGLSGWFNRGSQGSGTANVGSGIAGALNTGTRVSGLANTGSDLAGALQNPLGISDYLNRVTSALNTPIPLGFSEITISDILIAYGLDVPIDIPVDATFTDPIQIPLVTVPTVTIGPGPIIQAAIVKNAIDETYPTTNPCGVTGNPGACVVLELIPTFSAGGGVGPIEITPGGILTPTGQQLLSAAIGGPGTGVTATGTAGIGPIRIVLPTQTSPTTIKQFPYQVDLAVTVDVPVTTDVGVTISQFSEGDFVRGVLDSRYGYCIGTGVLNSCTPNGLQKGATCGGNPQATCYVTYFVWGTRSDTPDPPIDRSYRGYPRGPFPPSTVLNSSTSDLINTSGGSTEDGQNINFVINGGVTQSFEFSRSGTFGPFPR